MKTRFSAITAAVLLALVSALGSLAQTGTPLDSFAPVDRDIQALMQAAGVPGGSVAIVKDGRLVFARGYGLANIATGEKVQPDSLFRVGSISKTVTALALLNLFENGRLDLDARAYTDILTQLHPPPGAQVDPRIWQITVRQLLHHAGGHGRDTGIDPLNAAVVMAVPGALGSAPPATHEAIVRYVMGMPLDFDPGTKYSYSNYGFMLLARVVERITGMPYESFVRQQVLAPMGIRRMALGRNSADDRLPGEVLYYEVPHPILELSLTPGVRRLLPRPYANFELLAGDGCGQWVASSVDLVRMVALVEGSRAPAFLKPETFQMMLEKPVPFASQDPSGNSWYGMGTGASTWGSGRAWSHGGAYPGNLAGYDSLGNGVVFAFAFNAWPQDSTQFLNDAFNILGNFCLSQQSWPSHDLFSTYYLEN